MRQNINDILAKDKVTGKELGIALVEWYLNDKDTIPLNNDALNKKVDSLTAKGMQDFSPYVFLKEFFTMENRREDIHLQQFYNGYNILALSNEWYTDNVEEFVAHLETPLLITSTNLEELRAKAREVLRSKIVTPRDIITNAIGYYILAYGRDAEAVPRNIRAELDKLEGETITDSEVLKNYYINYKYGGYFQLEDGTRSDKVSPTAWKQALTREYERQGLFTEGDTLSGKDSRIARYYEIYFRGIKDYGETMFTESKQRTKYKPLKKLSNDKFTALMDYYLMIREGTVLPNDTKAMSNMLAKDGDLKDYVTLLEELIEYPRICVWKDYDTQQAISSLEYLPIAIYEGDIESSPRPLASGYKRLYEVIISDLESKLSDFEEAIETNYTDAYKTYGELADKGILDYRELTKVDSRTLTILYQGNKTTEEAQLNMIIRYRLEHNGVAVCDKCVSFEEQAKDTCRSMTRLARREVDSHNRGQALQYLIKPSLRYIFGYRRVKEILCKEYGIKLDRKYLNNLTSVCASVRNYNEILTTLYGKNYNYTDECKDIKDFKRFVLKATFRTINLEEFEPTYGRIKNFKKLIRSEGFNLNASSYLTASCDLVVDALIDPMHNILLDRYVYV